MNAQEILENLAKLESNLRNIDSARKQVCEKAVMKYINALAI